MIKTISNAIRFQNEQSPFTELFNLLKRYELLPQGALTLAYHTKELKVINQHVANAKTILTQGLEDVFNLLGATDHSDTTTLSKPSIPWTFWGVLMNLNEALDILQSDTAYVLRQRRSH